MVFLMNILLRTWHFNGYPTVGHTFLMTVLFRLKKIIQCLQQDMVQILKGNPGYMTTWGTVFQRKVNGRSHYWNPC